jgi:membrane associated rhomboid family serine protease
MRPMFLIPTGTDRDDGRRPFLVPLLVVATVGAFVVTRPRGSSDEELLASMLRVIEYGISYDGFSWWQPITYQFLHGGWFHLISNMFFLAAFGVVLEARLGHFGFLAFYLAGGAFAGLAQVGIGHLLSPEGDVVPAIGASGSVSAMMGAAFALHPRANVRGIAIPQFVRAQTSLQWMMAFAIALDIARTIVDWSGGGNSGIATLAHLGGLAFGFLIGIGLLGTGVLKRDDVDALYLIKQWRRRREMRAVLEHAGVGSADGPVAARVRADGAGIETDSQRTLRNTIAAAHRERDYVLASQLYLELLQTLPDATLPAAIQLDVANQLASDGRNAQAATAYTRFLERFRSHVYADDVRVMLAAIQARRLGDKAAARATLDGFGGRELDRDRQMIIDALRRECA